MYLFGTYSSGTGQHFSPNDPRWKGADSAQFLAHAASLVRARGGRILSGDITIRIPANSSFNLVANGQAQSIDLNVFASPGLSFVGDGRKVYGNVDRGGGPRSSLIIFNQRGRISFLGR